MVENLRLERYLGLRPWNMSNVRLTLPRGIPSVDTADVRKSINILCQRGKWDIFRILKTRFFIPTLTRTLSLCSALRFFVSRFFVRSRALTVALKLSLLVLSLSLSTSPFSCSHSRSLHCRSVV